MTTHKFNIDTPHLKADIQASLPIAANVSPIQAFVQFAKAYFKFATHQALTFFKKPAAAAK